MPLGEEEAQISSNGGSSPETGPFILRTLLDDLPLSADRDREDITITCVEFLDQNLYVGTSASELLHFVQIPPDPDDVSAKPSYILASRLLPAYHEPATPARPGVQQILLLAQVNKACILCNWTVTFYSLPELSPVFGTTQIRPCNWIGGIDLNTDLTGHTTEGKGMPVTVLVSLNKKMRVIRIGEDAKPVRVIDFAASTISVRRESFACVANSRAYALLDVKRLLKIPLFPISSLDDSQSETISGRVEDISGSGGGISRSMSSAQTANITDGRGHGRSTSLGALMSGTSRRQSHGRVGDQSGRETPEGFFREASPTPGSSSLSQQPRDPIPGSNKALPAPPDESSAISSTAEPPKATPPIYLKPHIASPTPQEFLLVTGAGSNDPGVGMFVSLEGEVTRPTIEFEVYPEQIVVVGRGVGVDPIPTTSEDDEEGFVLASVVRRSPDGVHTGLEIQRWDLNPGEGVMEKHWLGIPSQGNKSNEENIAPVGIRSVIDAGDIAFPELIERLQLKRFRPFGARSVNTSTLSLHSIDSRTASSLERVSGERELFESGETLPKEWENKRNEEERLFASRLGHSQSRVVAWYGTSLWWTVRNPLALQLDARLSLLVNGKNSVQTKFESLDRQKVVELMKSLCGREAKTETEYLSLRYIKQRVGLITFMSILHSSPSQVNLSEYNTCEEALIEGGLDPRVVLSIVPILRDEIIEGKTGIWIHGGVKDAAVSFIAEISSEKSSSELDVASDVLKFLKSFLATWRKNKGFGSIGDEDEIFRSVDAALLIVLLQLDKISPHGPAKGKSIRSDLYELVDHGVDCFERAVSILESKHRLYVLSRLYQSRKMASEVLRTWRRIVEGDNDEGGEFRDGEQRVREYLTKIRNPSVVQEYGVWLAARNPKLGVQVFAEDRNQVKFEPNQVVQILREGAPGAVKEYLEYLVFNKNHTEYINELITYYLDIVTNKLEQSQEARNLLAQTYESYRALRPPKPTYRQFITENSIDEEWWHNRLRLLQLLGGSQGSVSYNVAAVLERISPYSQELVPEVIILNGRQSLHEEALRLLTHGLGDYDTAINYCLLDGSSIYHTISGAASRDTLPSREQQANLFRFLLSEFLRIEDISNRVEQTSSLLERFGGWFEVGYVLSLIPDTWSVELVSGFLVSALRRIVRERHETTIAKALSSAENLHINADLVGTVDKAGPSLEA
ncbi:hypothetical protein BJ875DRAFT_220801 [Amylocarpus encephaloides]|uniref:CNH domain-containing protein n=1 Tax=Amylocarpus encephaloides TaxID=45428 RepID=A0A9P8CA77_9HELO|nr:hypothetical protein BJ875DRAFT_220801 [Amylocarpus encephaloides]